tara:strand:+ start:377 stop:640 length:264 start_codon:yes stop_codon:yes gene_type:complete
MSTKINQKFQNLPLELVRHIIGFARPQYEYIDELKRRNEIYDKIKISRQYTSKESDFIELEKESLKFWEHYYEELFGIYIERGRYFM